MFSSLCFPPVSFRVLHLFCSLGRLIVMSYIEGFFLKVDVCEANLAQVLVECHSVVSLYILLWLVVAEVRVGFWDVFHVHWGGVYHTVPSCILIKVHRHFLLVL